MTTNINNPAQKAQIAFSLACLYAIFLAIYGKTIDWPFGTIDSPIVLAQAILYSPLQYFTSPYEYQFLTYNNLTPWVTLSWDLDYALFQLESAGYRFHHLFSAAILIGVIYLVLYRLTHSILNAGIFCFAIITLPATFAVVNVLVNRHYLEGMIFCLLSFLFADMYSRKPVTRWLALSVLFYGLSLTAKEVFIPLPGILFFFFPGNLRRKIVLIIPYAITLIVYMAWRIHMVSGAGGYSSAEAFLSLVDNPQVIFQVAQRLLDSLFVTTSVAALMLALVALLLVINFKRLSHYTKAGLVIGTAGVVLPLLALLPLLSVGFFSGRWLFAPSVAFLIFFSYLCNISSFRKLTAFVYLIVFVCSAYSAYAFIQKPIPYFVKGKGGVYKKILLSDKDSYIHTRGYSLLGSRGQTVWAYVAKLHNGNWGTLSVFDVGQLRYHDAENKKILDTGRKKLKPLPAHSIKGANLDLIEHVNHDPNTGSIAFSFAEELEGDYCFIYIYGENNGLLTKSADCRQWSIQHRELEYLVRLMGYSLSDVSMAVWSGDPAERNYSKPYKLDELINPDL